MHQATSSFHNPHRLSQVAGIACFALNTANSYRITYSFYLVDLRHAPRFCLLFSWEFSLDFTSIAPIFLRSSPPISGGLLEYETGANMVTSKLCLTVQKCLSGFLVLTLVSAASVSWAAHDLVCTCKSGDLARVTITLDVRGALQSVMLAPEDGAKEAHNGQASVPITVTGRLLYDERLVEPAGQEHNDLAKSARFYHHAQAVVKVAERGEKIEPRADRRFVVAESDRKKCTLWAPLGALTREEIDSLRAPGNSLVVNRLLPDRPVDVGDRWNHDADFVALLFNLDTIERCHMRSKLIDVKNGLARMQLTGSIVAEVDGATTEMEVRGDCRFDMNWGRITWLQLSVNEQRSHGFATPSYTVDAELKMRVAPIDESPQLAGDRVDEMLASASPERRLLEFSSPDDAYVLLHDRRWLVTGVLPRSAAMRMIDEGQLIAQCNIAQLPKLPEGRTLSLEAFQEEIQEVLGERFKEFSHAKKQIRADGYRVMRVVATGNVGELPIQWIYYHLSDEEGNRAAVVYTMDQENTEAFGSADMNFVTSFRFHRGADLENAVQQASASASESRK